MHDSKGSKPASVLVIDDESEVRQLLQHLLDRDAFDPVTVEGGREALEYLQSSKEIPDIVLLDISMPDMDGFEVLQQIQHMDDPPMTLVLSSQDREAKKIRAFELGAVDYITKPFRTAVLVSRLNRHLERERKDCEPFPGPWVPATELAE